ncbi:MAG: hypothetical protein JXA33_12770 [Anaerolineae bacterium]|nr:hypothetical protein [Anaerolineae bacterium]
MLKSTVYGVMLYEAVLLSKNEVTEISRFKIKRVYGIQFDLWQKAIAQLTRDEVGGDDYDTLTCFCKLYKKHPEIRKYYPQSYPLVTQLKDRAFQELEAGVGLAEGKRAIIVRLMREIISDMQAEINQGLLRISKMRLSTLLHNYHNLPRGLLPYGLQPGIDYFGLKPERVLAHVLSTMTIANKKKYAWARELLDSCRDDRSVSS